MSPSGARLVRARSEGRCALPVLPKSHGMNGLRRSRTCRAALQLGKPLGHTCELCGATSEGILPAGEGCSDCGWILVEAESAVTHQDEGSEDVVSELEEPSAAAVSPEVVRQVDLDLPRTHPRNPVVQARLAMIRSMLLNQAGADPELNYCQGMNLVAASFAFADHSASHAYDRFHSFINGVRGLWLRGFPLLEKGTWHFELLAKQRPWYRHLVEQGICPHSYLPQQWLTLFATWLPLPTLATLIDFFECEGFAGILAMSLAILDHIGPALQSMRQEELLVSFGPRGLVALRRHVPDAAVLAKTARAWLPLTLADLDRPLGNRIDTTCLQVRMEHRDVYASSPAGPEEVDLGSFFGNVDEIRLRPLKRIEEGATDYALKAVVASAETGRSLFNSLLRRNSSKRMEPCR